MTNLGFSVVLRGNLGNGCNPRKVELHKYLLYTEITQSQ